MRYAAVHRSWLAGDPVALDAPDAALGAWLRLAVHAADLELGEGGDDIGDGRIPACKTWSDRAWLRAVGTDRPAVDEVVSAGLARWDGDDLLVAGYDLKGQHAIEAKRTGGKLGGRPKKTSREPKPNQTRTTAEPQRNQTVDVDEPDVKVSKTSSKPPSSPFPSSPPPSVPREAGGDSDPNAPTGRQTLEAFADAYTVGTKRREFEKGIDAATAGDVQYLRDMRDMCDGDVADFEGRIAVKMGGNAAFASSCGIRWWATDAMNSPAETPPSSATPPEDPRMQGAAYQEFEG